MPPWKRSVAEHPVGGLDVDLPHHRAVHEHAGNVADEDDPLGAEADGERGGGLVGVDVERALGERRDDGDAACGQRILDCGRRGRDGVADEPERVDPVRTKTDLVAEQRHRVPSDRGADLRRSPRRATSRTTSSTSAVVTRRPSTNVGAIPLPLHLGRDLRACAVHDHDVVPGRAQRERLVGRHGGNPAAELEDDPAHVVYSALIRT